MAQTIDRLRRALADKPDAQRVELSRATVEALIAAADGRQVAEAKLNEPEILDDTSLRALVGEIGNQIHNIGCEYQGNEGLSERLGVLASECWAVAQQLSPEPAPDHSEWNAAIEAAKDTIKAMRGPIDVPRTSKAVVFDDACESCIDVILTLKKGRTYD